MMKTDPPVPRTLEARFRAVVESAPSGMLMVDRRGTIILVNKEIERLFGYPRAELLGHPIELLVPLRFRPEHPGFREGFFKNPQIRALGAGRGAARGGGGGGGRRVGRGVHRT